jgi:hypothetical protein
MEAREGWKLILGRRSTGGPVGRALIVVVVEDGLMRQREA